MTATATAQVRDDISRVLKLRLPKVHVTGFDRENLAYGVKKFRSEAEKDAVLISLLGNIEGAAIVYCSTRRAVEQLAAWCEERFPGRPVCAYHAGMPQEARRESQELFVSGADTIVVATNAFGMGINRADIRLVAHYNLPGSVEAYYQEAGRAGRDGKPARCVLLYEPRDLFTQKFFIDKMGENNPSLRGQNLELLQRAARRKLDRMLAYADSMPLPEETDRGVLRAGEGDYKLRLRRVRRSGEAEVQSGIIRVLPRSKSAKPGGEPCVGVRAHRRQRHA